MKWWRRRPQRRGCWHHERPRAADNAPAWSFIRETLINNGAGKMFWCTRCGQTWFV